MPNFGLHLRLEMRIAVYAADSRLREDSRYRDMIKGLEPFEPYFADSPSSLREGTDMILSAGGDGTYLAAAEMAFRAGIPVLGVNFGRLGFLSDCPPAKVAPALLAGEYVIEEREVLSSVTSDGDGEPCFALNEIALTRIGPSMLGVDVRVGNDTLPTYWADGLLIATSSGSTAYSLSVGGPICTPDSEVLIISPIAPHNLNVRPLIVPSSSVLSLSLRSREEAVTLSHDNRHLTISRDSSLTVSVAQFSLKRVRLFETNFMSALRSKLFWGEDARNESLR